LFANVVAHFGINYMAQLMMTMFPLLACISVAAVEPKQGAARRVQAGDLEQLACAAGANAAISASVA
jgi:hypothetical protein